jgi:cardiolipin synthase A/B
MDRLQLLLQGALASAHRSVRIMTPYFVPTPEISSALQAAAMRGVEVSIVLPERSDHPWLDAASRRSIVHLLERRVEAHLRPGPFAHSKMFLVDDYYALVGSANLDARSLRLNFELMVEVYDPAFVAQLQDHFAQTLRICRRLQAADLHSMPLRKRLTDSLCWLFSPYL